MKPYMKVSYALTAAKAVVIKSTGERIPLSLVDKHIYNWVYAQWEHLKSQGKEFFHNQSEIALRCDVSVSAVEKFVRKMVGAGVVIRRQKKIVGCIVSNAYDVLDLTDENLFELVFNEHIASTHVEYMLSEIKDDGKPVKKKVATVIEPQPQTEVKKETKQFDYVGVENDPDIPF